MTTIHLFIITDQAQANLIPIMQFKPDWVVLAVSDAMRDKGRQFAALLKSVAGYRDEQIIFFNNVPDAGLDAIKDRAMEIEDELRQRFPDTAITYHATGGTKLMALGFYEVFRADKHTVQYTDTAHGRMETLYPAQQPAIAIKNVLTIESYLLSMGKQYRNSADAGWQQQAKRRKALSKWLAGQADGLQEFWSVLNALSVNALADSQRGQAPRIADARQTFKHTPRGLWLKALEKINELELCQWDKNAPDTLYFNNADGALYLSGAWLEEFVWLTVSDLKAEQVYANVEFTELGAPKADVRNEIDCLIVHDNRLLMIECKTGQFNKDDPKNAGILYKLESLGHRTGGLFGDAWLVSARTLDDDTLKRAGEYRIKTIQGSEIKGLSELIKNWMSGKR